MTKSKNVHLQKGLLGPAKAPDINPFRICNKCGID